MSERLRRCAVACTLALAIAGPPTAQAQSVSDLRARIDRLQRAVAELGRMQALRDAQPALTLDTVTVGALRLLAPAPLAGVAEQAAHQAWPTLSEVFGDRAGGLRDTRILITDQWGTPIPSTGAFARVQPVNVPQHPSGHEVGRILLEPAGRLIESGEDSALRAWMGTTVPLDSAQRRFSLYNTYIDLVTSPWHAGQQCFLGDLARCRTALGLVESRDPIADWYDDADVSRMISIDEVPAWARPLAAADPLYRQCVMNHVVAACREKARSQTVAPPLSAKARSVLVMEALDLGGTGAYARLRRHPRERIGVRLAEAAGLPLDSVIARWRDRVIESMRPADLVAPRSVWAALLWGLVLGFLALRSSRWR